jgi:hypothetical protein
MKVTVLGLPVATTPRLGDPLFEEHASPECIAAHLANARSRLKSAEIAVRYFETLLEERNRQVAAGLWP